VISDEELGAALLEFDKRLERAGNDGVVADAVGQTKRGRGPARTPMRPPPEVLCAVLIVETWRYFRGKDPKPGSLKVAGAAEKYWRLAGGDAHDSGDEPLACWKPRFVEALRGSSDPEREQTLEKLRTEIRRHFHERGKMAGTLIAEIYSPN
jgi:hypothetical protein